MASCGGYAIVLAPAMKSEELTSDSLEVHIPESRFSLKTSSLETLCGMPIDESDMVPKWRPDAQDMEIDPHTKPSNSLSPELDCNLDTSSRLDNEEHDSDELTSTRPLLRSESLMTEAGKDEGQPSLINTSDDTWHVVITGDEDEFVQVSGGQLPRASSVVTETGELEKDNRDSNSSRFGLPLWNSERRASSKGSGASSGTNWPKWSSERTVKDKDTSNSPSAMARQGSKIKDLFSLPKRSSSKEPRD